MPDLSCPTLLWTPDSLRLAFRLRDFYPLWCRLSNHLLLYSSNTTFQVLNPKCITTFGLGSCNFARHYFRNHCFIFFSFRYLDVSVPWVPFITLCIRAIIIRYQPYCVPTFGCLRIITYLQFPVAFRSLSRPSSALSAKASTICLL